MTKKSCKIPMDFISSHRSHYFVRQTSRKSQIEEIKDRELKQAKRHRLSLYINQKFLCKFGR
jgi:hypothetical protein